MRSVKAALALVVLIGGLLLGGSIALAQTTPAGGAVQIMGVPAMNGGGHVLVTGAVGDYGQSYSVNKSGQSDQKGNYKLLKLQKGSILINTKQLSAALNNNNVGPTTWNNTTCSGTFAVTEPVPVVSGTKLYAGATGSLNVTVTFGIVLPLTKGKCNQNANPTSGGQVGTISGTGTLSF
jgi:hypothetical protein